TDHLAIASSLRQAWIQMQADQPVDDGYHIQFSFALFPHLVRLQKLFYHVWRDHFLYQTHIHFLADLFLQPIFPYPNYHEACPSFGFFVMASLCHLDCLFVFFLPSFPILRMSYSYLNSIGGPCADPARPSTPLICRIFVQNSDTKSK